MNTGCRSNKKPGGNLARTSRADWPCLTECFRPPLRAERFLPDRHTPNGLREKFSADHLTLEPDQTSFYQPIVIARKGF